MACGCMSVCFSIFVVLSLTIHLAQLVLNGMFAYSIHDGPKKQWFTAVIGVLLLPMVTVQLVSALLLLQKRGEQLTSFRALLMAGLHILQLGFIWRHATLLTEKDLIRKKRDLADLFLLQIFFSFSSGLPLLLAQTYLMLTHQTYDWLTLASAGISLLASCWAIASFRRQHESCEIENIILTWPGTLFRLLWRLGETVSRVLSLSVFAMLYQYWIFAVLSMHWLTMMVCICTTVLGSFEIPGINRYYKFFLSLLIAYIYSFCHLNLSDTRAQFRYITFYIIMFLENTVLMIVWYLQQRDTDDGNVYTILFISGSAFFIGVVSMAIYYRFFHIRISNVSEEGKDAMCVRDSCINCKLSLCAKHNLKLQRPFSAGWISQYQEALYQGKYYKNLMQDSLIDSLSEWDADTSACDSTSEEGSIQETNSDKQKKVTSFQSTGTYYHRRFLDTSFQDCISETDTDLSTLTGSRTTTNFSSDSDESSITEMSSHAPPSCTSSHTHLLTDNWESVTDDTTPMLSKNSWNLSAFKSIVKQSLSHWYSEEGYSTDHTLDSYQLPFTSLTNQKEKRRKLSVASDSTDCTICGYIKSNPSTRSHSQISKVFTKLQENDKIMEEKDSKETVVVSDKSAWYDCSDSGDSAFPRESVSSSMAATPVIYDYISDDGLELII